MMLLFSTVSVFHLTCLLTIGIANQEKGTPWSFKSFMLQNNKKTLQMQAKLSFSQLTITFTCLDREHSFHLKKTFLVQISMLIWTLYYCSTWIVETVTRRTQVCWQDEVFIDTSKEDRGEMRERISLSNLCRRRHAQKCLLELRWTDSI